MGKIIKLTILSMTIIVLGLSFGCATKGKDVAEDFNRATTAIQTARTAEAMSYAPLDLRIAEDKLAEARDAVGREDYDEGRRLADEALVNAQLAEKKADSERAKRAAQEMRDTIESLRKAVQEP